MSNEKDCIDCRHYMSNVSRCYSCVSESDKTGAWLPLFEVKTVTKTDAPTATVGVKHDDGKVQIALMPTEALEEIAAVFTFGAKKYAADNWRKGFTFRRVASACLRHLFAWLRGEDKDPETGLSHLAHAACNLMFLITFQKTGTGTDDRHAAS